LWPLHAERVVTSLFILARKMEDYVSGVVVLAFHRVTATSTSCRPGFAIAEAPTGVLGSARPYTTVSWPGIRSHVLCRHHLRLLISANATPTMTQATMPTQQSSTKTAPAVLEIELLRTMPVTSRSDPVASVTRSACSTVTMRTQRHHRHRAPCSLPLLSFSLPFQIRTRLFRRKSQLGRTPPSAIQT